MHDREMPEVRFAKPPEARRAVHSGQVFEARRRGRIAWLVPVLALVVAAGCTRIDDVSPDPAFPGQAITIRGDGFGQAPHAIRYDGQALEVLGWNDTKIVARTPATKGDGSYGLEVTGATFASDTVTHRIANAGTDPIHHVGIEPNDANILSKIIEFGTALDTAPTVTVSGPGGSFVVPSTGFLTELPATRHRVAVVGLRQSATYDVQIDSGAASASISVGTSALPAAFPVFDLLVHEPAEMQPGFTLLVVHRTEANDLADLRGRLFAIDDEGEIVWYYDPALLGQIDETVRFADGNFAFLSFEGLYREVDFLSAVVREIDYESLGEPLLHHDVQELPNGNLVTLGLELHAHDYPDFCGLNPGTIVTYNVVTDTIIEMTREGQIVSKLSLWPELVPDRIPPTTDFDFCLGIYDQFFGVSTRDLSHANALVFDATDDSYIVSLRNQNAILKIDRATGAKRWVIGEDDPGTSGDDGWPFLTPVGPFESLSQQHGLALFDDGHLSFYDNGNDKPDPPGARSRAVELRPDGALMEVEQVWDWADPDYSPPLFAFFTGSAVRQDIGTMLVADTAVSNDLPLWIRLAEVRQSDSHKVWEVSVRDDRPLPPLINWVGYNASRISSLYPP